MNRRQSWNIITMFCIMIFGFTIATIIKPTDEYSETENRTLAKMPDVKISSILDGSFEEDYEKYMTDQFVARDAWISLKTSVERLMQKQESKDIYFAKDDYLIEKHTGSFTSDTADRNIRILQQFAELYSDKFADGHMTFMIIPNAVDILSEKLPAFAAPYDQEQYLNQIKEVLPEHAWMDVSSVLLEHKDEPIYYRTDHHWKTSAAFYVYQKWAEQMGYEVPQLSDYEIETATEEFQGTIQSKLGIDAMEDSIELYHPVKDIFYEVYKNEATEPEYSIYDRLALDTKSKYDVFFGGNYAMVKIRTRANTGRKILVIKDSYAHCFVPFLFSEFDEIHMLDMRYFYQSLGELIEKEQYTDLLFLNNASGFAEETSISRLTS